MEGKLRLFTINSGHFVQLQQNCDSLEHLIKQKHKGHPIGQKAYLIPPKSMDNLVVDLLQIDKNMKGKHKDQLEKAKNLKDLFLKKAIFNNCKHLYRYVVFAPFIVSRLDHAFNFIQRATAKKPKKTLLICSQNLVDLWTKSLVDQKKEQKDVNIISYYQFKQKFLSGGQPWILGFGCFIIDDIDYWLNDRRPIQFVEHLQNLMPQMLSYCAEDANILLIIRKINPPQFQFFKAVIKILQPAIWNELQGLINIKSLKQVVGVLKQLGLIVLEKKKYDYSFLFEPQEESLKESPQFKDIHQSHFISITRMLSRHLTRIVIELQQNIVIVVENIKNLKIIKGMLNSCNMHSYQYIIDEKYEDNIFFKQSKPLQPGVCLLVRDQLKKDYVIYYQKTRQRFLRLIKQRKQLEIQKRTQMEKFFMKNMNGDDIFLAIQLPKINWTNIVIVTDSYLYPFCIAKELLISNILGVKQLSFGKMRKDRNAYSSQIARFYYVLNQKITKGTFMKYKQNYQRVLRNYGLQDQNEDQYSDEDHHAEEIKKESSYENFEGLAVRENHNLHSVETVTGQCKQEEKQAIKNIPKKE